MQNKTKESLSYRLACALLGTVVGGLYGGFITLLAILFADIVDIRIIVWSAAVFCVMGFFFGNFIFEAFQTLLHFFWGVICGYWGDTRDLEVNSHGYLRTFMLLGFGTGLVLLLWSYWR